MEENVEKRRATIEMEIHTYEQAKKQKLSAWTAEIIGAVVLGLGIFVLMNWILIVLGIALIIGGVVMAFIGEVGSAKLPSLHRQLDALEKEASSSVVTVSPNAIGQQTKYCRHCGQTIAVDAAFCEKCGKKLIE